MLGRAIKKTLSLVTAFALCIVSMGAIASAQTNQPTAQNPTVTNQATSTEELAKRIEEYKKTTKVELSAPDQTKIKNTCVAAQEKVRKYLSKMDTIEETRAKAYLEVVGIYVKLGNRLNDRRINVVTYRQQLVSLVGKIVNYAIDMTTFKQVLEDTSVMACSTDPVGFMAALTTARTSQVKVAGDVGDIRKYIDETIKKTIEGLRKELVNIAGGGQ